MCSSNLSRYSQLISRVAFRQKLEAHLAKLPEALQGKLFHCFSEVVRQVEGILYAHWRHSGRGKKTTTT